MSNKYATVRVIDICCKCSLSYFPREDTELSNGHNLNNSVFKEKILIQKER